jgi:membrane-associated phospholipid phosphatase
MKKQLFPKKTPGVLLAALLCAQPVAGVFAENMDRGSVYALDLTRDLVIGGAALGVFLPPLFLSRAPSEPYGGNSRDEVNPFDRPFMFSYNKALDTVSTAASYGLLVLPALSLLGNMGDYHAIITYGLMYTEAFLLTYGTKDLLKFAVERNRPYTYIDARIPDGDEDDYYNSFPSGHTSFAFLGATFLSVTFSAEYPDSPWKLPLIAGSYTLAAGVAAMRVVSGNHFPTDVLAGAAIGSLYGWLVPYLHLKRNKFLVPTGNGLMLSFRF